MHIRALGDVEGDVIQVKRIKDIFCSVLNIG